MHTFPSIRSPKGYKWCLNCLTVVKPVFKYEIVEVMLNEKINWKERECCPHCQQNNLTKVVIKK